MDSQTIEQKLRRLKEPFEANEIEWRVQTSSKGTGQPWIIVIPYITSRAVQDRLDEVFTPFGWQNEQKPTPCGKGYLAGISVNHQGEWLTKWDGAEFTQVEPLKGALSGSIKRAAVLWGIGRYLYDLDVFFAECAHVDRMNAGYDETHRWKDKQTNAQGMIGWNHPTLPAIALPGFNIDQYLDDMRKAENDAQLDEAYKQVIKVAKIHQNREKAEEAKKLGAEKRNKFREQAALNVAEDHRAINEWLTRQIESLPLIPNPVAIESFCSAGMNEIDVRLKRTLVDPAPLKQRLQLAVQDALNKFDSKDAA